MKRLFFLGMAVCAIFAIIACGNGSTKQEPGNGFTVTYNANGWTAGGIPQAFTIEEGAAIGAQALIPLDETDTQTCLGWSLTAGQNGERVMPSYVPTGNITLYALWVGLVAEGQPVTVTYDANGWKGTGVPETLTTKNSGDQIGADNLPALENQEGQIFYGWAVTSGQTGTRLTATYVLRGNTTLYVLWTAPVTLSFDYNFDGAPAAPASVDVGSGIAIGNVLPAVADTDNPVEGQEAVRPNYLFQGWYTAAEGGQRVTAASTFTESVTLYAQWKSEPAWGYLNLDLTMVPVVQGSQWGVPVTAEYGADGSLTWKFDGNDKRGMILFSSGQKKVLEKVDEFRLIIDGETSPADSTIPFRFFIGHVDYTADWNGTAAITQGVFANQLNNQVTFNNNKMKVEHENDDGSVQLQEPRIQAYILQQRVAGNVDVTIRSIKLRYDKDIGGEEPGSSIMVSYNRNYDGAPVGPNPAILTVGDKIGSYYYRNELPVLSRELYIFKGWFTQASGGTQVTKDSVYGTSSTIYAQWEELPPIDITFDLNYTTSIEPPETKTIGAGVPIRAVDLPTVTRPGYLFKNWSLSPDGGENNAVIAGTTVLNDDTTLYAEWEASDVTYAVTFNKGYYTTENSVIITVNVPINDTVGSSMPTDPIRSDYEFTGWYTTALVGGTEFKSDTGVSAAINVYARWTFNGVTLPDSWQERNTMTNTAVPVYGFKLPDGDKFGDYDRIKVTWKFDAASPRLNARLRAWGNFNSAWAGGSVNDSNRPPSNAWNASPAGLLLNANGNTTYAADTWFSGSIEFTNRDTLSTASAIKNAEGLILLAFAPIPNNADEPSPTVRIYWVKEITLENADGTKKVSALHPLDSNLWNGTGAQVYFNQGAAADTLVREWMTVE